MQITLLQSQFITDRNVLLYAVGLLATAVPVPSDWSVWVWSIARTAVLLTVSLVQFLSLLTEVGMSILYERLVFVMYFRLTTVCAHVILASVNANVVRYDSTRYNVRSQIDR